MRLRLSVAISLCFIGLGVARAGEPAWTQQAGQMMIEGRYQEAADLLLAVQDEPDAYTLHVMLGNAYLALGLPMHARAEYDACLVLAEKEEEKAPVLAALGMVALLIEDREHARRLIDQGEQCNRQNRYVQYGIAFLALEEGRPERVLSAVEPILSAEEGDLPALMLAAVASAEKGAFAEAGQYLDRLFLHSRPEHPLFLMARYRVRIAGNEIDEALADLAALQAQLPAHVRLAADHARLLVKKEGYAAAVKRLEAALAASPDLPFLLRLRAEIYLSAAIPGRAAEDLERLVANQKALTNDYLLLAEAYRQLRRHEQWLVLGRRLESERPASPDGPHLVGACLEDQDDVNGALQAYARALQRDPHFAPTRLARAELYMRLGRLDEARLDVADLLQVQPHDRSAKLLLASIEMLAGQFDKVEALAREVVNEEPDNLEARILLMLALEQLGRAAEAAQMRTAVTDRLAPTPVEVERALLVLAREGRHEEVVQVAGEFLQEHPNDYAARALRIDSLVELKRYAEAMEELEKQVELWGPSRAVDLLRAKCLAEMGDLERSLALLDEVLRYRPDDLSGLYLRGMVRQRRGDLNGALDDFIALARLDTEAAAPRLVLARLFIERREFDRARAEAWLYLSRTTRPADGWRLRGQVEMAAGDYKQAVEYFSKALELQPADLEALRMRAEAYEASEQAEAAAADRERIKQLEAGAP